MSKKSEWKVWFWTQRLPLLPFTKCLIGCTHTILLFGPSRLEVEATHSLLPVPDDPLPTYLIKTSGVSSSIIMMEPEGTLSKFPYKGPNWAELPFAAKCLPGEPSPCGALPLNYLPFKKTYRAETYARQKLRTKQFKKAHVHVMSASWTAGQGMQRRGSAHPWEAPHSQTWPAESWGPGLCLLLSADLLQGRSLFACSAVPSVNLSDQPGSNSMRLQSLYASASLCFSSLVSLSFSSSLPSWNNLTSGCRTRLSKRLWAPLDAKFACRSPMRDAVLFGYSGPVRCDSTLLSCELLRANILELPRQNFSILHLKGFSSIWAPREIITFWHTGRP